MNHTTMQRGFTLIEMAIVLTIIALIVSSGLAIIGQNSEDSRARETQERLDVIMQAIAQYAEANTALPCPADPDDTFADSTFGQAGGSAGACGTAGGLKDDGGGSENPIMGAVPIGPLGLSPKYMLDGWDRRFSYVVDQENTSALAAGDITIQDAGANNIVTDASIIVFSHGVNGYGAWRAKGGTQIDDSRAANEKNVEEDNAEHDSATIDATLRIAPLREIQASTTDTDEIFDDIVSYRTYWQLQ